MPKDKLHNEGLVFQHGAQGAPQPQPMALILSRLEVAQMSHNLKCTTAPGTAAFPLSSKACLLVTPETTLTRLQYRPCTDSFRILVHVSSERAVTAQVRCALNAPLFRSGLLTLKTTAGFDFEAYQPSTESGYSTRQRR
jgi:hypothetical protein